MYIYIYIYMCRCIVLEGPSIQIFGDQGVRSEMKV